MVSFGEKAKVKKREIWIKVVVMLLQLYYIPFHIHDTWLLPHLWVVALGPTPCAGLLCGFQDRLCSSISCHKLGTIVLLFLEHGDVFDWDDFSKDSSVIKIKIKWILDTLVFSWKLCRSALNVAKSHKAFSFSSHKNAQNHCHKNKKTTCKF